MIDNFYYSGELLESDENKRLVVFQLDDELSIETISKRSKNNQITAQIEFDDSRKISSKQRGKIYALIGEIGAWSGHHEVFDKELIKEQMKWTFMAETGADHFSLSNVDMTTARHFITWIIEFCITNGVPLSKRGYEYAEDIKRYVYYCLKNRICCITGAQEKVHIHHVTGSKVGLGRDRNKINHTNLELLPLRADLHQTFHQQGDKDMLEAYHLVPVKADKELLKELKLNHEDIS